MYLNDFKIYINIMKTVFIIKYKHKFGGNYILIFTFKFYDAYCNDIAGRI